MDFGLKLSNCSPKFFSSFLFIYFKFLIMQNLTDLPIWVIVLLGVLALFDAVMKLIAMWRSARNNHLVWFIFLAIFNTIGILPIVYLILHKKKSNARSRIDREVKCIRSRGLSYLKMAFLFFHNICTIEKDRIFHISAFVPYICNGRAGLASDVLW